MEMLGAILLALAAASPAMSVPARPLIFPKPQEIQVSSGYFVLDDRVTIVLSAGASPGDATLARALTEELSDRYGVPLKTERAERLPAGRRLILMGSIANPLIQAYCGSKQIDISAQRLRPEGYLLHVDQTLLLIAGIDDDGAFHGLQSLRQAIQRNAAGLSVPALEIRDWPDKPFRGFRLYLPGRDNIPFFKRFVRDVLALYKFNKLMLEMNACMRLDRHPELNAGWVEFARDTNYSRLNYPPGMPHQLQPNSSHQDTADGGFLEKEEVADLVRWAARHHIEVIPEIPSLTHSLLLAQPASRPG